MWAEDGYVFVPEAIAQGWRSLLNPALGYFFTLQRIIVILTLKLVPLLWAPVVFHIVTVALFAGVASRLVREEYAWLIPSWSMRAAGAILLCLAPGTNELVGNLANVNWILFYWLALLGFQSFQKPPKLTELGRAVLCVFSIGTFVFLIPLFSLRAWYSRRREDWALLAIQGVGIVGLLFARTASVELVHTEALDQALAAFLKSAVDLLIFHPWLGDWEAVRWRSEPYSQLGSVCTFLMCLVWCGLGLARWRSIANQALISFTGSLALWPILAWLSRPNVFGAFDSPLSPWFLVHRYAFAVAAAGIIFWLTQVSAVKNQTARRALYAYFIMIPILTMSHRFWIAPFGMEDRWRAAAMQIQSALVKGSPCRVLAPIYPDPWTIDVTLPACRSQGPVNAENGGALCQTRPFRTTL